MICSMHRRIAGFVSLLSVAFAVAARPALAQQADSDWFDDSGNSAPPPAADDSAPQLPSYGPQGQPLPPQATAPQATAPQAAAPQSTPRPAADVPETDPSALTEFRPTLDPYGTWVNDDKYGTVWVPNQDAVGPDFAPYVSDGHWTLTDDNDWSWQSDYPFGDVVFHYGRWVWVPSVGWAWVAGRQYANAWVTWRVPTDDYGYVGWAPMSPAWGWYDGSAVALGWYAPAAYVFCPSAYAFSYHVNSYIVHDRYVIRDVASHTRNYAGNGHVAASPRVLPANSAPPRGPSVQSAHIPASSVPTHFSSSGVQGFAGARGSSYARSSSGSFARADSGSFTRRPINLSNYGGARPSSYGTGRTYSIPSNYARSSSYVNPASNYGRAASFSNYRVAPQRTYPSSTASRFNYTPPVSHNFTAPSRSYSAPAAHYSAPSSHYSAPSRAPSFHTSVRR
ncbi:MAG TPA: DUF6600 domain-containing protein [Polyangiaceae bacterium]|nr:DUF6600 domain-containing protein [Polyangiaceae bacterium]